MYQIFVLCEDKMITLKLKQNFSLQNLDQINLSKNQLNFSFFAGLLPDPSSWWCWMFWSVLKRYSPLLWYRRSSELKPMKVWQYFLSPEQSGKVIKLTINYLHIEQWRWQTKLHCSNISTFINLIWNVFYSWITGTGWGWRCFVSSSSWSISGFDSPLTSGLITDDFRRSVSEQLISSGLVLTPIPIQDNCWGKNMHNERTVVQSRLNP